MQHFPFVGGSEWANGIRERMRHMAISTLHGMKRAWSSAAMNPAVLKFLVLLTCSNVFMTFAWYAHLRNMKGKAWYLAALFSWGIALFEYLLQVPANRIGSEVLSLPQLKIIQEVITLAVFIPFAIYYMKQPPKLDFLWSALCMCGAVYFMFRK
jgi:uncharacterized protein (DUF486 family)